MAATFYDKVASPKAVTDKERQFAKEIVYGESPVCLCRIKRNKMVEKERYKEIEKLPICIQQAHCDERNPVLTKIYMCLHTQLHVVALAPMKV